MAQQQLGHGSEATTAALRVRTGPSCTVSAGRSAAAASLAAGTTARTNAAAKSAATSVATTAAIAANTELASGDHLLRNVSPARLGSLVPGANSFGCQPVLLRVSDNDSRHVCTKTMLMCCQHWMGVDGWVDGGWMDG